MITNEAILERQPCKVLLVDDSSDIACLIKAHLNDPRIRLTISTSGRAGIQAFKQSSFDLVLMDLQMPDGDGYQATREIRFWEQQKELRPTPIAALTASSSSAAVAEIFNSGFSQYLAKPITRNVLLQTVAQYFSSSQKC